ncbi:MAG: hypothetical protein OEX82_03505 [Nitrosomonas sp.]|nr:hypothetical protein [Nitrosomonas sp.]
MNKHNVSTELDDDEILNKLDALLHRHKNQADDAVDVNNADVSPQAVSSISGAVLPQTEPTFADEIPTLTEIVLLQSDSMQAQAGRMLSLQQILDSALDEVNIEMKTSDRIMLTKALEKQLTKI